MMGEGGSAHLCDRGRLACGLEGSGACVRLRGGAWGGRGRGEGEAVGDWERGAGMGEQGDGRRCVQACDGEMPGTGAWPFPS